MTLEAGSQLLHYRLVDKLGEGGMGVVWKALDTELGREVAIKILPEAFSQDAERLARFEREARLLASLSHPNIAVVHGLHAVDSIRFLVMELVPGEDLQQRAERGRLPLDEVTATARQIASALEAAHEHGVIHRDLKPANVIVGPDGTIKVIDFGLAKTVEAGASEDASLSNSPTMTSAGTMAGVILGTAGYMSPEQAKGMPVDRRADIWAFGVLLFEMLSGERMIQQETVSEAIAAVLMRDPDWNRLPAKTPRPLSRLVRRCLTKDPRSRLRDIGEARIVLENPLGDEDEERSEASESAKAARFSTGTLGLVLAAGLAVGFGVARMGSNPTTTGAEAEPLHLSIAPPEGVSNAGTPAVSPDGRTVVYVSYGSHGRRLVRRDLGSGANEPIPGTEGALAPFFSPDSRWVGFAAGGKIRKVSLRGGDPLEVADVPEYAPGAAWALDGSILYSPDWLGGLARVPGDGGEPEILTTPDAGANEQGHWWPQPLPDGRHVLFTVWYAGAGLNDSAIAILDLETRKWTPLMRGARAKFSAPDRLLFYRAGIYQTVRFDPDRRELLDEPVTVNLPIMSQFPHGSHRDTFAVGPHGMLVFTFGESLFPMRRLIWVDRAGETAPAEVDSGPIFAIALASDDRTLATSEFLGGRFQLFVQDVERRTKEQLQLEGSVFDPRWLRDGSRLSFGALRRGNFDLYSVRRDGSDERQVVASPQDETPLAWFLDGKRALIEASEPGGGVALHVADAETGTTTELLPSGKRGLSERLSPDDRWIAFDDLASGRSEIYVQRIEGPGPRIRVSSRGGSEPIWCSTANELYFLTGGEAIALSYTVDGDTFVPGEERVMFRASPLIGTYDAVWQVTKDCSRFLLLQPATDAPSRPELRVVYNWAAGL